MQDLTVESSRGIETDCRGYRKVVTVDGRQPISGIEPDPCINNCLIVSAGCCHRSLDFGGLYHVYSGKMEPFYLESAVYDLKSSENFVVASGKGSILSYNGTTILSGSQVNFQI